MSERWRGWRQPRAPRPRRLPPVGAASRNPAEEITEEELLAISAAVAAYLGVRAHIRQVRLVSSQRRGRSRDAFRSRRPINCTEECREAENHHRQKTYEVDVEAAEPETAPGAGARATPWSRRRCGCRPRRRRRRRSRKRSQTKRKSAAARSRASWCGLRRSPGQRIQPGDILLVLEAMKMETNITAPMAGKLSEIKVKQGDSVQSGQVVVEFE